MNCHNGCSSPVVDGAKPPDDGEASVPRMPSIRSYVNLGTDFLCSLPTGVVCPSDVPNTHMT